MSTTYDEAMQAERMKAANGALAMFSSSRIERRKGGWYVCWESSNGQSHAKRWAARSGQDFYATWSHKWPGGGTAMTALSQLIRWLRGDSVLPIATWKYWTGAKVGLGRENGPKIVETLRDAGYPERAYCVLCGGEIQGGMDWWSLDGLSGPCCGWTTGCRQKEIT